MTERKLNKKTHSNVHYFKIGLAQSRGLRDIY